MQPWDLPITHNPLKTRDDLVLSLAQILEPLKDRFVPGDAGLHLGYSAAHYEVRVARLEAFSRLLWGLVPLWAQKGTSILDPAMVRGLKEGVDPQAGGYWGLGGDRDQRYVEMAAFALALLLSPDRFWTPLAPRDQENLVRWLSAINRVELPPTNWEFFRILVNLALKSLRQPYDQGRLEAGFGLVEQLYRTDGWYIDETNYDLYNPFAFHFYGLIYARLFEQEDPKRAGTFRARAREFCRQFVPWFGSDGTMVPHGRSLTYRFSAVAFFSACAFAGEEVLPWGQMKGMVLRHLRWWFQQPIFDHEGVLTIGYSYPNLVMAEQYNAPGSPYWALKTYLILGLDAAHPFWSSAEEPLPALPAVTHLPPPHLLVCRQGAGAAEHVYLLAGGQYPCWESVHSAAKYAKFAYSNRFGFCVSHGSFDLGKTGCDSSLVFSEGDGYWRERRHSDERTSTSDWTGCRWHPWSDVEVTTRLIPFGAWHLRVHRVVTGRRLESVEGGFSLPDSSGTGPQVERQPDGLVAWFPEAYGGVFDLSGGREASVMRTEPNLNVLHPRVQIPVLKATLSPGTHWLMTAVLAGLGPWKDEIPRKPGWSIEPETGRLVAQAGGRRVWLDLTGGPHIPAGVD